MPMFKKSMVVLALLVLAAAGGALYSFSVEDTAVRLEESALPVPSVETPSGEIVVYVSGEVANPGVVRLAEGSRAIDAVNACGGVLPTADMNGINMAQSLKDGMQLIVSVPRTRSRVICSFTEAVEELIMLLFILVAVVLYMPATAGMASRFPMHITEHRSAW